MKFEQQWPRGFSGGHLKLSPFFSIQVYRAHTNAYGSKLDLAIKRSNVNVCTTIILETLVDLPSPMICGKVSPQVILSSGEEDF